MDHNALVPFWENWDIWIEAMLVSVVSAAVLAYLGLWVTLKRVTYVPLAISQVAALGVVIAFLLHEVLAAHSHESQELLLVLDPAWFSFLFSVSAAFYFATPKASSDRPVAIAYLSASSLALILGGFVRQDLHDIKDILFGHTVLAEMIQLYQVLAAATLTALVHGLFYRRFLYSAFDPDAAGASGMRVYLIDVLLYATIAIMLSTATRTMGALPAFGLMILPALAGLQVCHTMRHTILTAIALGTISAGVGYYFSFALGFSAGASMVACASVLLLGCWIIKRTRR